MSGVTRYRAVVSAQAGARTVRGRWFATIAEARASAASIVETSPDADVIVESGRPGLVAALVIGLAIVGLMIPVALMEMCFVNPFDAIFTTDFVVDNRTDEPIWVTLIGTVGKKGARRPLWMVGRRDRGDIPIDAGDSLRLHYDWDDINFSEVVVRDARGRRFQMIANPDPVGRQYVVAPVRHFVVSDLDTMVPMAPALEPAYRAAQTPSRSTRPVPFALARYLPWLALAGLALLTGLMRTIGTTVCDEDFPEESTSTPTDAR